MDRVWSSSETFSTSLNLLSVHATGTGLNVTIQVTGTQILTNWNDGDTDAQPAWSPDSKYIGLDNDSSLYRINAASGAATQLQTANGRALVGDAPDWNPAWVNNLTVATAFATSLTAAAGMTGSTNTVAASATTPANAGQMLAPYLAGTATATESAMAGGVQKMHRADHPTAWSHAVWNDLMVDALFTELSHDLLGDPIG